MKKISRNDPCPCGSGKKHKHCCGLQGVQAEKTATAKASIHKAMQAAVEHHQAGRLPQAEAIYRQILQAAPNHPDALHLLGLIAHLAGKNEIAVELIVKAISVSASGQMFYNLGNALRSQGKLDAAIDNYRKALTLKPDYAEAHSNLGAALQEQGKLDEAVVSFQRALSHKPDYAEAYYNLGIVLKNLKRHTEAVAAYQHAIAIKPNYSVAYNNLGVALKHLKRYEEAVIAYQQAIALETNYATAYNNLGNALIDLNRHVDAIAAYQHAIAIKPGDADARYNCSMAFLSLGQFQRGWKKYEMRWKFSGKMILAETPYPCWLGAQIIAGKKLLIQFEQGFGDAIQMVRYVTLLEKQGAKCWIQVRNPLLRLIIRSFPEASVVDEQCPTGLDYRIPIMSLPLAMETFSEFSIPNTVPYLFPDQARVAFWQEQLMSTEHKTVGLAWRGRPEHKNDSNRSATLTDILSLIIAHPLIQFVTLQKELTEIERNMLKAYNNVRMLDSELTDFDESAAVISNLDIMISVDSAPAHLSGALGKTTWILLPFSGEWRWLIDRPDTPWYPTAKLFRQKSIGNWPELVGEVSASLANLS